MKWFHKNQKNAEILKILMQKIKQFNNKENNTMKVNV